MGAEMTAVDVLNAFQIEAGDYIKFLLDSGMHEGVVSDVEDKGHVFIVTLIDNDEGDQVVYEVPSDTVINLMMYSEVAV